MCSVFSTRMTVLYSIIVWLVTSNILWLSSTTGTGRTAMKGAVRFVSYIEHSLPDGLRSLDGSDPSGGCHVECLHNTSCRCPGEGIVIVDSVLNTEHKQDRLDTSQTNWARHLFTLNRNGRKSLAIGFRFSFTVPIRGVEVTLFNCPEKNIASPTIALYKNANTFPDYTPVENIGGIANTIDSHKNCSTLSIVEFTVDVGPTTTDEYFLEFSFGEWEAIEAVYLSGVRFSLDPIGVNELVTLPSYSTTTITVIIGIIVLLFVVILCVVVNLVTAMCWIARITTAKRPQTKSHDTSSEGVYFNQPHLTIQKLRDVINEETTREQLPTIEVEIAPEDTVQENSIPTINEPTYCEPITLKTSRGESTAQNPLLDVHSLQGGYVNLTPAGSTYKGLQQLSGPLMMHMDENVHYVSSESIYSAQ